MRSAATRAQRRALLWAAMTSGGDKAGGMAAARRGRVSAGARSREAAEANLADNGGGWALRMAPQREFRSEWENSGCGVATTIT